MKTLIRLESVAPNGIYALHAVTDTVARDIIRKVGELMGSWSTSQHPVPYDDSGFMQSYEKAGIVSMSELFFGFCDDAQFRAWFPDNETLKQFNEWGITLACYRIPFVIKGNAQSAGPIAHRIPENEVWRMTLADYIEKGMPESLDISHQ